MSNKSGAKKQPSSNKSKSKNKNKGMSPANKAKNREFEAALKKDARKKRLRTVLVVLLAVVFALGMMLPALSSIFANNSASSSASTDTSSSDETSSDTSSDSSDSTSTSTGVAAVDAKYTNLVAGLESKLESDPNNLAALLNLGNDYMAWAYSASSSATTDDEKTHVSDLWQKSLDYYDRYLEINDSAAVKVDRALCQYYAGDTASATAALEALTEGSPDYGPAWANLGLMYESASETDKAKAAYEKAEETDANDEYGAKSYATQRLAYMESSASSTSSDDTSSNGVLGTTSDTSTTQGLSDALANATGTSL